MRWSRLRQLLTSKAHQADIAESQRQRAQFQASLDASVAYWEAVAARRGEAMTDSELLQEILRVCREILVEMEAE